MCEPFRRAWCKQVGNSRVVGTQAGKKVQTIVKKQSRGNSRFAKGVHKQQIVDMCELRLSRTTETPKHHLDIVAWKS